MHKRHSRRRPRLSTRATISICPLARGEGLPGLGGAKVRLVFADHQADPQKGRAEAERPDHAGESLRHHRHLSERRSPSPSARSARRYQIPVHLGGQFLAEPASPRPEVLFPRPPRMTRCSRARCFDFFDAMKKKGTKIEDAVAVPRGHHLRYRFRQRPSSSSRTTAGLQGCWPTIKYRANSPSLSAEGSAAAQGGQCRRADAHRAIPPTASCWWKTMAELGYKPNAIVAQDAGFSEKALYDAVGDKLEGVISRGRLLARSSPPSGRWSARSTPCSRKSRARTSTTSPRASSWAWSVMADAINRAKSTDGGQDPRGAGGHRHAGRADDHAVEAREVR